MLAWLALAHAATPPVAPCGTMALLPSAPAPRTGPVLAASGPKALRDAFDVPNQRSSPDFVVRWGNQGTVTTDQVDRLLDAFELAWSVQVGDMEHPQPYGTDAFKFNVYVGDTGNGTPSGYATSGYYYVDPDGWPMVVVSAATLLDPDMSDHTATHEFYHAVQSSTNRFSYDETGPGAWYFEATAEWAALETKPDNPSNGLFVYGYLLLPELPVDAFDYPDTGALTEYHQYGAFLFPWDLTSQVGWELVRDSWVEPGTEPDPVEVMRSWLADRGEDLDELWLDHLGHLPVLDVPEGDLFQDHMDVYGSWFGDESEFQAELTGAGGEGSSRGQDAPQRYGAAILHLADPVAGTLAVTVTGEPQGSEGSPARYGGRVVREDASGRVSYVPITFTGTDGTAEVDGIEDTDEVYVAIGAWTASNAHFATERFPLDWSVSIAPATPDPVHHHHGGGAGQEPLSCDSTGAGGTPLAWLLALAAVRRRSRA